MVSDNNIALVRDKGRLDFRCCCSLKPREKLGQDIPKRLNRWQGRKLMGKHISPTRFQIRTVAIEITILWN